MTLKLNRLERMPPEPTKTNPHAQLDWLCERFVHSYKSEETKAGVRNTIQAYKRFLNTTSGYDQRLIEDQRFYLSIHCHPFMLYDVEEYWRELGHSSHTRSKRLWDLRKLLNFASENGLTSSSVFFFPRLEKTTRETLQREAYETKELELIWTSFNPDIAYARKVAEGYRKTGGSRGSVRGNFSECSLPESSESISADLKGQWRWEDFVQYFENQMNCQPVLANRRGHVMHREFFIAASKQYGSITEVWRRLGVAPLIDVDLIIPLAMKLCWETGLNTGALLSLKRDCFRDSHPLTGQPYLLYYKERSTGEKLQHLNLFNSQDQDQIPLRYKQSEIIRHTIELILKLTEPLISSADASDKDLLFIYQTQRCVNGKPPGSVIRLHSGNIARWTKPLLQKLKDAGHEHVPVYLNLARFRPSRITQMVRDGKDFFDIQAIAGHAGVRTTLAYLSSHQIAPQARREVSSALQRIHENKEELESHPKAYATADTQRRKDVIYKGVLCDCKNVYDPPSSVRRLKTYKTGQACTYFNMCLRCPNVVITKKHLPLLVSYKQDIEQSMSSSNLTNVPNTAQYEQDLAIIEGVMLEFDPADISWALEVSECADGYTDPVVYRMVQE